MSALSYLFCAPPVTEIVEEPKPLSFSIGVVVTQHLTRRERLAKAKQKKVQKKNVVAARRRPFRYIPPFDGGSKPFLYPIKLFTFGFTPGEKRWLLCDRGVPYPVINFLREAGKNFTQIYLEIIKKKRRQQSYFSRYKCYTTSEPGLPILKMYLNVAIKNQRLRTAFGRLAKCWIQKRLRSKNEEDLMTGEEPVEPVVIVDWTNRSIYNFEAKTICRDMVSRLLVTTWTFFPAPKSPRNPYTNEELTESQFYSVMKQLRRHGQTHWALEALYSCKYNLKEFDRDMYLKLKRTHHNAVFSNPESEAAKEILLDFIEDEHKSHGIEYEKDIYDWASEHQSYHHKMHEWRVQCEKHYRIQHFPGDKDKDEDNKDKISDATKRLCAFPFLLVERYDATHEKKYVKLEDRHAAVAQAEVMNIHYVVDLTQDANLNLVAIFAAYAADLAEEDDEEEEEEAKDAETVSTQGNDSSEEAD